MQLLIFREGAELKRVKCPRPLFPPVPLTVCKTCRWHHQVCIPTLEDDPPFVVCGFDGILHDAECVQ